jgi:hypothetical protein
MVNMANSREVLEAWNNYLSLCAALSQIPTMHGFGKHLVDSYGE